MCIMHVFKDEKPDGQSAISMETIYHEINSLKYAHLDRKKHRTGKYLSEGAESKNWE